MTPSPGMIRSRALLRRRSRWSGLWPQVDRSGLWTQVRWLVWTFDHLPEPIATQTGRMVDDLRGRRGRAA